MPVELIRKDSICVLKINNPPRNVLSSTIMKQLQERLEEVKGDENIKAVVLTGQGIFSVGADPQEIYTLSQLRDENKIKDLMRQVTNLINGIYELGKITVAVIEGYCLGGGNELAMTCHYRIAGEKAIFGQPEITLGIMPGMGGTQLFPRLVGVKKALPLLLTGEFFSAKEAEEIGLVDKVIPEIGLKPFVTAFIKEKLNESPYKDCVPRRPWPHVIKIDGELMKASVKMIRESKYPAASAAILEAVSCDPTDAHIGFIREQELFLEILKTEEAKKGLEKFLGKSNESKKSHEPLANQNKDDKSEELKMMREMVRDFAENRIRPMVPQMEKEKRIPPTLINEMAELGLFGVSFDEKYGGSGLGLTGFCVLMEELSKVHGSTAVMVGAHQSLACKAVYLFGSEDQKNRYLVPGIKGEKIGAYATTEPSVGSDLANIKTTAKKENGVWVLSGAKQFISNGAIADFVIVLAQTNSDGGNKTQAMFIVDTTSAGFKITKETEEKIGLHASCTSAFSMDNLIVPEGNLLGKVGDGFKIAMNVFNQSRISLGAGCLGSVKAALDEMIKFSKDRYIGGEPLWAKQLTQVAIGKIYSVIYKLETLVYPTAALWDKGLDVKKEAAVIKYVAGEEAFEAIDLALQVLGGSGYIEDYPIARIWRDVRVNRIFEGTSEVQLLLIAKEVLKEKL